MIKIRKFIFSSSLTKILSFDSRAIKKFKLPPFTSNLPVQHNPINIPEFEEPIKLPKKIKNNLLLRKAALKELLNEKNPKPEKNFVFLPQTQDFNEIMTYFFKFKKILKTPQYLIIFSRIAHLKNARNCKLDPRLHEFIREACKLNLNTSPKYIANFIKYSAMIGIHHKIFWRKLISEIYKTDYKHNLTEFALTFNYLQVHGILSKSLLNFFQDKAVEIIQLNPENQSYRIMELLLNSVKNYKINPELLKLILGKLHLQIHIMPLKNLRNCFVPFVQMKLEDSELWKAFQKWIFLRMDIAKKNDIDIIIDNYSYLIFTFAKMVDDNRFNFREKFIEDDYKGINGLFYEIIESEREKVFRDSNSAHFLRIFKAFTLFSANYSRSKDLKILEFLITYFLNCRELNEKFKLIEFYEFFTCIIRIDEYYKPFEKHQSLLDLLNKKLFNSLELPFVCFKSLSDFFLNKKDIFLNEGVISEDILKQMLTKMRETLISMVRFRTIKNEQDLVTLEKIVENFRDTNLIDKESAIFLNQQIKKKNI